MDFDSYLEFSVRLTAKLGVMLKDIVLQVRRTDDSVPRSRQLQERKGINGDGS